MIQPILRNPQLEADDTYTHVLLGLGRATSAALGLNDLLHAVYQSMLALAADTRTHAAVALIDPTRWCIEAVLQPQRSLPVLEHPNQPLAGTLFEIALQQPAPLVTHSYAAECRRYGVEPQIWPDMPLPQAWLGVPLLVHDEPIGLLSLGSLEPGYRFSAKQADMLHLMAHQVAAALMNARLRERVARQEQQLASLKSLAREINSSLDVERMPQLIIDQAQLLLDAEEGSLLLADGPEGDLVFAYASGPFGGKLLGQRLSRSRGIAGYVASTGRSAVVNDVRADGRFYGNTDEQTGFTTRSLLAVPLRGRAYVEGVIEVMNKRSGKPFDDDDRQLLEALAEQAVVAFQNAQRFAKVDQALARRAQELAVSNSQLHEILRVGNMLRVEQRLEAVLNHLVQAVSQCTGFPAAMLVLVRYQGVRQPLIEPVCSVGVDITLMQQLPPPSLAWVEQRLQTERQVGEAAYLLPHNDPTHTPWRQMRAAYTDAAVDESVMLCPLRASDGRLLGLLGVGTPHAAGIPSSERVQSLEIFANQAASAIENAALYDQLQHNLQSLTALNALSMALNSTLRSVPQIVDLTAGGAVEATSAIGALVLLGDGTGALRQVFGAFHGDEALLELAAYVIAEQRPQQLVAHTTELPQCVLAQGGQSLIAVPLRATQSVLGAMVVLFAEATPPAGAQETLVLFAGQAAVATESLGFVTALHEGRDRLASIMASTREGMLMVDPEGHVLETNAALAQLCGISPLAIGLPLDTFFMAWREQAPYASNEWEAIAQGVAVVATGAHEWAHGQLTGEQGGAPFLEWAALPVCAQGLSGNGVLLVLRDITAAKQSEQLRQDLSNMIVHDLRSPITGVITALDLLLRDIPGATNETQQHVLAIARKSSQSMLDMINLLLDISRLEGGSMPLSCALMELAPLVTQACQNLQPLVAEHQLVLEVALPATLPCVYGDSALLGRVVQNLLDNAIKFSSSGGRVCISATHADDAVVVAVRDEGVGIALADQHKIFERFAQAGERRGGSGLGLTFCKLVVEAHGGTLTVESRPGVGSTFRFSLPTTAPVMATT
jgi:signal transduction histidine kinase/GAF domain-containing protein